MPNVSRLRSPEDIEAMLAASHARPVLLLKHSSMCFVSHRAHGEFDRLEEADDPPRYLVVVQEARAVSNLLAERLGVRHETPQAHVLSGGRSVFVANHAQVRTDSLRRAAREALPAVQDVAHRS